MRKKRPSLASILPAACGFQANCEVQSRTKHSALVTELERTLGVMHNLPLYPDRSETHGLALARQRDMLLRRASERPERFAESLEKLCGDCVFETLGLTGAPLAREAIAAVQAGGAAGDAKESDLIRGQLEALSLIKTAAESSPELTENLLREVHRLSTPDSGGVYRTESIPVQFAGASPSRPALIPDKIANLCDWLSVDSGRGMNAPEKAALAFARLVEISPFEHGNFRTGHLLLTFFAFADRYPPLFLRLDDADAVREEVERAMAFETLPLVNRLARSLASSLSFCLDAVSAPSAEPERRS